MTDNAVASTCLLSATPQVTSVPICARRTICYEFDTRASGKPDLDIPYLVIVNGIVQNQGKPRRLDRSRKIKLTVEAGSTVALYLNSDVHPDHRRNPVYAIQAGNYDIMVKITEQLGKDTPSEAVVGPATIRPPGRQGGSAVEYHTTKLTGDVWMSISHRYTATEVETLLPSNVDQIVRTAVCSIYRVMPVPTLNIPHLNGDGVVQVSFLAQSNAQANITRCSLLRDVLTRTHPSAFAALFCEARAAGVTQLHITSCWRPLLGSIVHRLGLGLDIVLVANSDGAVQINRNGLTQNGPSRNPYVSDEEKARYQNFQRSQDVANRNPKSADAAKEVDVSRAAWETEMRARQPALIQTVRNGLRRQDLVEQILDPWYVELGAHGVSLPRANSQRNGYEKLHKDHLHITMKGSLIHD